jgi:hypothetical protein
MRKRLARQEQQTRQKQAPRQKPRRPGRVRLHFMITETSTR